MMVKFAKSSCLKSLKLALYHSFKGKWQLFVGNEVTKLPEPNKKNPTLKISQSHAKTLSFIPIYSFQKAFSQNQRYANERKVYVPAPIFTIPSGFFLFIF